MKTKKLSKKLGLNKRDIARLSTDQLTKVQGGAPNETRDYTNCTVCDTYTCVKLSVEITACVIICWATTL